MKIRVLLAAASVLFLSGCVGIQDSEGWHYSQKREFLKILENDKYASLCDQQALYRKVKESENSILMSRLLVAYTDNLANSCIDIPAFKQAQRKRKSDTFKTHFEVYHQKVDPAQIRMQLQAGQSIENILKPYIPTYREWDRLLGAYRVLQKQEGTDPVLLHKVRLNLERVKLLKPETSKNYALVNIPEFRVRIIENGKTAISMGVVVGKQHMQTPIFGEDLKYIVVNPQWNVPDSIARKEVIPKTLRNPGYLKRHRLVIRRDYNLDSPALSFNALNPKAYAGGTGPVPFKFIEPPSKRNGLGRVKFLFPNHHSVYMHDTQSKYLFKRKVRMYSHGCVRLERPNELLKHIVTHYTNTPWEKAKEMYDSYKTHYITLTKRLPVHTAYFTIYIDDDGAIQSFKDVYGYDTLQKLKF
jgi:murein L,D-transpeptidase YcbB/YkuD